MTSIQKGWGAWRAAYIQMKGSEQLTARTEAIVESRTPLFLDLTITLMVDNESFAYFQGDRGANHPTIDGLPLLSPRGLRRKITAFWGQP